MSFLNKIFGAQSDNNQTNEKSPDNKVLLDLLNDWRNTESPESYRNIVNELLNGQSFLFLPSVNDRKSSENWNTLKPGSTLKLTSVFDANGLQVLAAFSDESALLTWSRRQTEFTAMRSQDVLEFCQTNGIDRIVINSDQPTMFVLERSRENIKSETIQKETQVSIWPPKTPISGKLLDKLKVNFSKVSSIREVFHFGMTRNDEHTFILAFSLDIYSDDARFACMNAIQNSMSGETLEFPLELFYLDDENWYNTAKGISNSLVYKRR